MYGSAKNAHQQISESILYYRVVGLSSYSQHSRIAIKKVKINLA
jgi:hypothetical protein